MGRGRLRAKVAGWQQTQEFVRSCMLAQELVDGKWQGGWQERSWTSRSEREVAG